jgi:hypothetical protein
MFVNDLGVCGYIFPGLLFAVFEKVLHVIFLKSNQYIYNIIHKVNNFIYAGHNSLIVSVE